MSQAQTSYIGKRVYTVNAVTGEVDPWICEDEFIVCRPKENVRYCKLKKSDKKLCYLSRSCVYLTREHAKEIANRKNF